jgi:hypothetical protein
MSVVAAALLAGVTVGLSTPASAFGTLNVTEDPVTGYTVTIPTSVTPVIVASDGEATFQPFGIPFDVSDAISLSADWAPDPAYAAAFAPGGWTQLPGSFVWYLSACSGGICENGNVPEPIGKWDFTPGGQWTANAMNVRMFDPDGTQSDSILIANDGPNGGATVSFQSGIPEPATWAMMLVGFGLTGFAMRKRPSVRSQRVALALS